jgi:hypothetical protein
VQPGNAVLPSRLAGIAAAVHIHSVVVGEREFRGDCVHLTGGVAAEREKDASRGSQGDGDF